MTYASGVAYIAPVKQRMHFILLLAILVQALIPVGFMPGRAVAGTYMEICTPDGIVMMNVGQPDDQSPDADHGTSKPCAFSLLPVADVPRVVVALDAVVIPQDTARYVADYIVVYSQLRALPPATAPPVLI